MNINTFKIIRKLAKSNKYQSLFSYSKELGIKLFKNDIDLTDLQITFLRYLSFYSSIYMDLALGDIDEVVLENDIYEDSYVMYRNKTMMKKEKNINNNKPEKPKNNIQWVFNRPTGKRN
jgi:hypothetical protein